MVWIVVLVMADMMSRIGLWLLLLIRLLLALMHLNVQRIGAAILSTQQMHTTISRLL